MISLIPSPPAPLTATSDAFVQTLYLKDGDRLLGRAIWCAADPAQGVIQLIELWIDPAVRRSGHGRRLLRGVVEQARALHKLRNQSVRRIWVGLGHKTWVVGRAFLTGEGFHHISTTGGLLQDEDQLIYVRSLD